MDYARGLRYERSDYFIDSLWADDNHDRPPNEIEAKETSCRANSRLLEVHSDSSRWSEAEKVKLDEIGTSWNDVILHSNVHNGEVFEGLESSTFMHNYFRRMGDISDCGFCEEDDQKESSAR